MPLGGFMITAKTPSESSKVLLADAEDLSSRIMRTGLSPDSYKAIIKQGLRPEHKLRFSRDTFQKLNSSAVDNAHLYKQWKEAATPELKQQFVKDWNEQIYPRTAFINKDGKIEFLQPFVFYRRDGGLLKKNKIMKIIYNKIIPFKGFLAINLFGFLFARKKLTKVDINHEKIHTQQMKELLYIPFYVLYILEYIIRLCIPFFKMSLPDSHKIYRSISFEQEAYKYEMNLEYLKNRKRYNWIKYIKKLGYVERRY